MLQDDEYVCVCVCAVVFLSWSSSAASWNGGEHTRLVALKLTCLRSCAACVCVCVCVCGVFSRVCILLPTAGENLEVVFKALVGALSQRLWDSGLPGSQTLRVIVLDEKRRLEVYRVAAGVHRIGELLAGRRIQQILMVSPAQPRVCSFSRVLLFTAGLRPPSVHESCNGELARTH